ncbi:MAG: bacterioferritin [Cardiobacteriaceae bacterium]|nr:bacterioferritin [Cardiobacteriaceae bacterium]
MKGHPEVVAYLNEMIGGELAARDQYFIHARMYEDWGYTKLFEANHHEMEHETEHATQMIRRVLFLEGTPNTQPDALKIGTDVMSMMQSDLELEYRVRDNLKRGIVLCEKHQDFVTKQMLIEQLKDTEEDHAHWLEQQLRLIKDMGLENYLQSQAK